MALPFLEPGQVSEIKGSSGMTKQANVRRFVKGQGWTTIEVWEGPLEGSAVGLSGDLQLSGFTDIEVRQVQPGVWRVEASIAGQGDGAPEEPVNTWELLSTAEQVDIKFHNKVVAMDDEELRKVVDAVNSPNPEVGPALTSPDAIELYMLMMRGVNSYPRAQYILRHTVKVPNDNDVSAAVEGSMGDDFLILNSGQLPSMPSGIGTAVSLIGQPPSMDIEGADGDSFFYGWLKQPTNIVTDVFGGTTIVREWWLANWPLFIYHAKE